ncbi:hypothetical protein [Pseudomonas phage PA26]|uniref:Uncharacterized protein n=1 Tax=Pseudomonas phage PA26 TaxID=1204542 RepID=I7D9L5_9CAUD|nr:hypothetical protein FDH24_gp12 [Pseudomonas phage PA26]YP_010659132.1 hypothetical protein PP758_gp70 [Pseudomonas phage PAP02]WJZ48942.1 hypothetical protein [Pseudomonas phage PA15]WRN92365.1 hypothetical protein [Pseudomonas phage vB_Pae_HMKU_23]WVH07501.1 hypothetical protein [Pseudomonas phage vB_PaP_HN01]AFO70511.1 hypothetical protein [Pseudomonas phage PA26]QKE55141.1 hypothetical protein PAP02_070 [Pseudomonas phage PAP02]
MIVLNTRKATSILDRGYRECLDAESVARELHAIGMSAVTEEDVLNHWADWDNDLSDEPRWV